MIWLSRVNGQPLFRTLQQSEYHTSLNCHLYLIFLSLQSKQTVLHYASSSGHNKVCQVLLQAGADALAIDDVSI